MSSVSNYQESAPNYTQKHCIANTREGHVVEVCDAGRPLFKKFSFIYIFFRPRYISM